jgi:hypothetical protein
MTPADEELRAKARRCGMLRMQVSVGPGVLQDLLDRIESAENVRDTAVRSIQSVRQMADQAEAERDTLLEALTEVRDASMAYDHSAAAMTRVSRADRSADALLAGLSGAVIDIDVAPAKTAFYGAPRRLLPDADKPGSR